MALKFLIVGLLARTLTAAFAQDLFLLSGQSNMVGHTTSKESISKNGDLWRALRAILDRAGTNWPNNDLEKLEQALRSVIAQAHSREFAESAGEVAAREASELVRLFKAGLLYDLDTELTYGSCSFAVPRDAGGLYHVTDGALPTTWHAGCGATFGHEFMFSRTLELQMGQQSPFEMVKIARGGTEMTRDWYPGHGMYWDALRDTIASKKGQGNWKGFVWHQGSQESWTEEDTSLTYLGNVTCLVHQVRTEMFEASQVGTWNCKEEIPVVIVQLGVWPPYNDRSNRVRNAQKKYCRNDPRAAMVEMSDLSHFYHFDAPSFLIGGNRIAEAFQKALGRSVQCPGSGDIASQSSPTQKCVPRGDPCNNSSTCCGQNSCQWKDHMRKCSRIQQIRHRSAIDENVCPRIK